MRGQRSSASPRSSHQKRDEDATNIYLPPYAINITWLRKYVDTSNLSSCDLGFPHEIFVTGSRAPDPDIRNPITDVRRIWFGAEDTFSCVRQTRFMGRQSYPNSHRVSCGKSRNSSYSFLSIECLFEMVSHSMPFNYQVAEDGKWI